MVWGQGDKETVAREQWMSRGNPAVDFKISRFTRLLTARRDMGGKEDGEAEEYIWGPRPNHFPSAVLSAVAVQTAPRQLCVSADIRVPDME